MSENLRDRYAEALRTFDIPAVVKVKIADAVRAVRDDVLAEKDADLADARGSRDMAIACAKWRGERLKAAEAEVARLREENAGLRETVGRVEALHHPITYEHSGWTVCDWCDRQMGATDEWPCPTITALAPRPSASEAPPMDWLEEHRRGMRYLAETTALGPRPEAPRTRDDEQGGER